MKITELTPQTGQKSFYGKALIFVGEDKTVLKSYLTEVASISKDGTLTITSNENHLTRTTLKHINSFLNLHGIKTMSKKEILNR